MEAIPGEGRLNGRLSALVRRGSAADLHGLEPTGAVREVWWLEVDRPALVLGSAQPVEAADADACAAAGVEVVRRRSGGGAVLMLPGEIVWLDVIVPRDDPQWDDDVGRSMWWVGEAWATALRAVGVDDVAVHRGPQVRSTWSSLVCFDGLGAGEVTVAGAKAVGISQRRTRSWARMQTTVHLRWRPSQMVGLLASPRPSAAQLGDVWTLPPDIDVSSLLTALEAAVSGPRVADVRS